MRLLFITDHAYLPQRVGGTKSSTHDLCVSLRARGHDVAVLCRLGGRDALGLYHRVLRRIGRGDPAGSDRVLGYPVYRTYDIDDDTIGVVAARTAADLVIVQAERPSPLIKAALATGRAVLVYLRDVELHKLDEPLPAIPRIFYIANSANTAGRYRQAFGVEPLVLPPLVRPERFRCTTTRQFVTFVNPVPLKGSDIAFALAEARPDIPFLFVAGWPVSEQDDAARQERARRLGNIQWQPTVQDMRRVYGRTRIMLVPSRWEEGWGRVVTEAQVSGIPALASRRGGLPEAVGDGGELVDPDGPLEPWVAALSRLWDDPAHYAALSAAAVRQASRPEIQPDALITAFERAMREHVHAHAPMRMPGAHGSDPPEQRSVIPARPADGDRERC